MTNRLQNPCSLEPQNAARWILKAFFGGSEHYALIGDLT